MLALRAGIACCCAALFRVSFALFHLNAPAILAAKDEFGQLFNVLQKRMTDMHDPDLLIKVPSRAVFPLQLEAREHVSLFCHTLFVALVLADCFSNSISTVDGPQASMDELQQRDAG